MTGEPTCHRCATPVRFAQTLDGWRWVALQIDLSDRRRYWCPGTETLHTR